jgi:DNA-binding NtrC family response regulator
MSRASPARILVVDDEATIRDMLRAMLEDEGYEVESAADGRAGLERLRAEPFDIVITDLRMQGMDGIELLRRGREAAPETLFVVVTAYASLDTAIEALRLGAVDYLLKPVVFEDLIGRIRRLVRARELLRENLWLRHELARRRATPDFIGESAAAEAVRADVARFAATDRTVLLTGESGTGKDVVATMLHQASEFRDGPFLPVNCAALPEPLLESELFGYEKGAFTGADRDKPGLLALAEGGTFFLDEIAEIPPAIQAKLLRVLEKQEYFPVGGTRAVRYRARLVAATNRDLKARTDEGSFRQDLYFRLNVIPIHIPPLRERAEDIPALARYLLERHRQDLKAPVTTIGNEAMQLLVRHPWPGNVRELENVIQRAILYARGSVLRAEDLPPDVRAGAASRAGAAPPSTLKEALRACERELILRAMKEAGGSKPEAAARLGISLASLYQKLKDHGAGA